ncbi:VOC family protein [Micavibrio aeruginosavorus]|uniref:Lactoylglutathione lyase n=1 Tax=Micavibrio aeruginosavorus EPB TaxID=349215 RepID=M4VVJ8_9BACT|nr:VOC family protein [Micavibrio aeruginosavorus]AGH97234.1 Lactoylglutathione lyase [Micavibrio aeruginosavorus EPB]
MKFGYTIIYVPDVQKAISFYESAFGLKLRFLHDSNQYGELETGATALAFASEDMHTINGIEATLNRPSNKAAGIEIALVTEDVVTAHAHAVASGATEITKPDQKPWGQTVSYVRDLNGVLVEICSPIE